MTRERVSHIPRRPPIIGLASVAALTLLWPPLVTRLLDVDYMPHGHCYWWEPGLVGVHLVSDALIGLAYLAISLTLAHFVRKSRVELPFHWMFLAFGIFIIACGGTHVMEIVTLYVPVYWISGYVKIVTALASVATAVALPPLIPKARAMLAAALAAEERLEESTRANAALAAEVEERRIAEAALRDQIAYVRLLQTVASAANEEESIEPALETGVRGVCELAGWPIGRVLLAARDGDSLVDAGIWYVDEAALGLSAREARSAFASYVEKVLDRDADRVPDSLESTKEPQPFEIASRLVFPLRAGKRVIGALEFQYVRGSHPDAMLMDLVENVCAQLGRCVERHETERTMKEVENQLRAFTAQLQGSNRELQDFAFVASHDLQEPLRKIQTLGDMLREEFGKSLDPDALDYLDRMQKAAHRMQALIRDLLEFSRISSRDRRFSSVDLATVVAEALSDLEVRLVESDARVAIEDLPVIDADPLQMRQLFLNVIGNALKFAKTAEPPHIEIRGRVGSPREGFCEILIKDNGVGFDERYAERIFNVFQRLHGQSVYEGTGIGLAICRRIVERHGGTIAARSTPRVGSEFVITLPIRQRESEGV
jgi:signal transduction histidine kinase